LTPESLQAVLDKGDEKACLALCINAPESERKAVAGLVVKWLALQAKHLMIETAGSFTPNPLLAAAQVAALGCCSLSQLKEFGWKGFPGLEEAYAILRARRPAWIDEWMESVCLATPWRWPLARRLVRERLCRRPAGDSYILGMVCRAFTHSGKCNSVRKALLADAELLKNEVWRLFEVEGNGEFSLAAHDKYCRPENTWATALIELAAEGKLSRARLLDASLDALERDFAQFRAGWFSRFHEALAPEPEERAERAGRYLGLLASRIPPTVSFALKALQVLDKAGRLPSKTLVEQIRPAFAARQKGTVKSALGFLDRAARREPELKPHVAIATADALAHEAPEVQAAALELLEKHGESRPETLVTLLQDKLDGLAASQRPRLLAWLGSATKPAAPAGRDTGVAKSLLKRAAAADRQLAKLAGVDVAVEAVRARSGPVPALELEGAEIPRLNPEQSLQPIQALDDLIDLFATVIEDAGSPEDMERVLDGVSRLGAERPEDFGSRTAPLAKRAQTLLKRSPTDPFVGLGPAHDACGVALAWTGGVIRQGVRKQWGREHASVLDFHSARALAVARRAVRQEAAPLLSAPTHAGGWLDPLVLVERVREWEELKAAPDIYDQVQALLRLAPDHRATALRQATKLAGEYGAAVRCALGSRDVPVGPTAALWVAAARARDPFADAPAVERRHPGLGPDAGRAARYSYRIKSREHRGDYTTASGPKQFHSTFYDFLLDREPPVAKRVSLDLPTVLLHADFHGSGAASLRWGALTWPLARESWFAIGAYHLARNLDWWEADWAKRTYLEPLLDPDVPLKPMALLLLALGLAAKEPGESGLAADALIHTIEDGRLDPDGLGEVMASLLSSGIVKAARWAKTLGDAARMSPLHARAVAAAIERALQAKPAKPTRDLVALLELLLELLMANGQALTPGPTREYLAGLDVSGKTAKLVTSLLALKAVPRDAHGLAVACQVLSHRLERAERWARSK
jgi:hypothetical protein